MFLIIDGSSMLTTNYYGTLPYEYKTAKTQEQREQALQKVMQTSDGIYTNGVYATLRMILQLLRDHLDITHLAIVFDKSRNTFRRTLYSDYKQNRFVTPPTLQSQFRLLEQILQEIGLTVLYDDNYEADDLAGSIVETFKNSGEILTVMTKDHDYLQLIDDNVYGWIVQPSQSKADEIMTHYHIEPSEASLYSLPNKTAFYDKRMVLALEQILPSQVPDFKGLCGDSSDNIPGVKGVGPSAAIPLLRYYGTLEYLYRTIDIAKESADDCKELNQFWKTELGIKRSPLSKLIVSKEIALLSKQLATIKRDIPVPNQLSDYPRNIDDDAFHRIIERYQFHSLQNI